MSPSKPGSGSCVAARRLPAPSAWLAALSLGRSAIPIRRKRRIALSVERGLANRAAIDAHPDGPARGLLSLLIQDKADRGRTLSVEDRARGISRATYSQIADLIERHATRLFSNIDRAPEARALVRELFDEDTTNTFEHDSWISKEAKAAAAAFRQVADALRERFNLAGGDIGQLDNWNIPMSHSQERVRSFGAERWVERVLPLLDRDRYTNIDGSRMSTTDVKALLHASWETISSGGMNDVEFGPVRGRGMIANRHREHRILHFKNADAWWNYHQQFSDKTVLGIITAHINGLSRDIALIEQLGPNPQHAFRQLLGEVRLGGATGGETRHLENVWAHLSGEASRVEWQTLARFGQGVRNLQSAAKLGGGAVLSSVTDFASTFVTGHFNGLPFMRHLSNTLQALNPLSRDDLRLAHRAGLGLDALLGELNRWADDSMGGGWSAKLASKVLRLSGLQALTEANRRAFSVTMIDARSPVPLVLEAAARRRSHTPRVLRLHAGRLARATTGRARGLGQRQ